MTQPIGSSSNRLNLGEASGLNLNNPSLNLNNSPGLNLNSQSLRLNNNGRLGNSDEQEEAQLALRMNNTTLNNQLTLNPSQVAVSSYSSQLVRSGLESGALSLQQDQLMLEEVNKLVHGVVDQIIKARQRVDEAIQIFYSKTMKFNDEYADSAARLMKELAKGKAVQAELDRVSVMGQLASQVGTRYHETATQLVTVQNLSTDGRFKDYQGAIELLFFARFKEVELLSERLGVLHKQEDHELELMTAIQNEQMKKEAHLVDQFLKTAKFQSEDEQRKFDNQITLREQKRKEEEDIRQLALSKYHIDEQSKVKQLEANNKKQVDEKRIEADKFISGKKIDSEARCRMYETTAKTAVSLSKPSCRIM